ncbi:nuclear transport factor 2 family protein [Hymenobacter cheonanensis]|uniref:nuclear transport factor 2 family protein n=1 Tax=Hymenobacter sp. CA2-7 TaxID=3063993 RepID=UPI002714216D|nr:nuclear transport factor 2 family protein [Hymenobacter sp. CA2-7]MDO7888016.1 nuclear transport factor 2 family protein [Hymenobacter sp. CA2-7]
MEYYHDLIRKAYAAFNARDIPTVLTTLHPEVRWSKAWEGDYATGHDEVREYWLRQWQELNPQVMPTGFKEREDGRLEVAVHQIVRDKQGQLLFDGPVKHLYTIEDKLFKQMDIEQV